MIQRVSGGDRGCEPTLIQLLLNDESSGRVCLRDKRGIMTSNAHWGIFTGDMKSLGLRSLSASFA